jgi:hypothetical protein
MTELVCAKSVWDAKMSEQISVSEDSDEDQPRSQTLPPKKESPESWRWLLSDNSYATDESH